METILIPGKRATADIFMADEHFSLPINNIMCSVDEAITHAVSHYILNFCL